MKEVLLEYMEDNPYATYKELCQTFGIKIPELFSTLGIVEYKIRIVPGVNPNADYYVDIYDSTGRNLIYSEHASGKWVRYEYNSEDRLVCCYNNDGFTKYWEWLKDGEDDVIYMRDTNGFWIYTFYGPDGQFKRKHDINDDALGKKDIEWYHNNNRLDQSKMVPHDITKLH